MTDWRSLPLPPRFAATINASKSYSTRVLIRHSTDLWPEDVSKFVADTKTTLTMSPDGMCGENGGTFEVKSFENDPMAGDLR